MISYLYGKIVTINKKSIVVENNYTGWYILVADPSSFELNKYSRVYIFKHLCQNNKNNYIEEVVGFKTYQEKNFFMDLIGIQGIGVKTALHILENGLDLLQVLIGKNDIEGLNSLSGINNKVAINLCNSLAVKCSENSGDKMPLIPELINALKTLGYSQKEVDYALSKMRTNNVANGDVSIMISEAIRAIASKYEIKGA